MVRKILLMLLLLFPAAVFAQSGMPTKAVTDEMMTGDVMFSSDTVYVLDGFVFVEDGSSLTIEAGTIVKAKYGQAENASALIIARGGKIYANGTAVKPIIFTAESDDVTNPNDIPINTRGLWGGVIILGDAGLNNANGKMNVEGIPIEETRGEFGGANDHDNSGVFRFVSIRYGGSKLGEGDEINGLTMGGVGDSTIIEYVEVFGNDDDGFEWFGGTVNTRYLISAFNLDDGFDYDVGFRGKGQFWFVVYSSDKGDNAGEHDGGTTPEDGTPYAIPVISNVTYIGSGASSANSSNELLIHFRDNAGGKYYNSIFTDFFDKGIYIEDLTSGQDSRARLEAGDLAVQNNIFYGFGAGNTFEDIFKFDDISDDFIYNYMSNASNMNSVSDPMLGGISRTTDGGLDPRPKAGSPAWSGVKKIYEDDSWFHPVAYKGAFGSHNWASGWSFLSQSGILTTDEFANPEKNITDAMMTGDVYFSSDTTYILNGFVFVEDGSSLTIEAGTVIKANPGQAENASALIIARGGKIYANGTPTSPIIFTALNDDVNDPNDLPLSARGLWGGVIILGKAGLNNASGEMNVEGIPIEETRGKFGGTDDEDNSGVFRYVSIRYGGSKLGEGDEINGLTMGGVGSGTTIEYVEVFANDDDGFEWFGGTVNTKYLISAFNLDDGFDYDVGFRGKGQFWFVLYSADKGDNAGEHDGGTTPEDGTPYAIPEIYNATYIGSGAASTNSSNDLLIHFRDNAGGKYYNSIFTDFYDKGIYIEDLTSGEDSRARLEAGDLAIQNNIFYGFGAGNTFEDIFKFDDIADDFIYTYMSNSANSNRVADPSLRGISRTTDGGLDPRPAATSPAWSGIRNTPDDNFFTKVNYIGAFGTHNWAAGWTFLSQAGILTNESVIPESKPQKIVTDDVMAGDIYFSADTTYILYGFVFLEEGGTLTIEPGTVIKANYGQAENASALIICRGAKIYAEGTADNPVIFTALNDDVNDPFDLPMNARGLWGGVIILGKAGLNNASGEMNVEGIPVEETRGKFGGKDDTDNSGIFRYVSIRHGGSKLGEGDEINGLTMGGVGSGTTIEYVEVFANDDDGFEWFGGTVNTKYLVSAFNLDDGFDYDVGFRGMGQFWFVVYSADKGDNAGEHDGGTTPEDGTPYAIPQIYNVTYIGSGAAGTNSSNDLTIIFRDNAGGKYYNSIFTDFYDKGIYIEDLTSGEDSRSRLEAGDLVIQNNIFYGFGAGNTFADIFKFDDIADDFIYNYMSNAANSNRVVDPMLYGISRTEDTGGLDPRPRPGSPAWSGFTPVPENAFFTPVNYVGAFGKSNWATGWTFLSQARVLTHSEISEVEDESVDNTVPSEYTLNQNYPNPFNPVTTINYSVPKTGKVTLTIYNILGQKIAALVDEVKPAGNFKVQWNASHVASGMYLYKLEFANQILTKKMVLLK